jgi:KUP system potassium uptake protein
MRWPPGWLRGAGTTRGTAPAPASHRMNTPASTASGTPSPAHGTDLIALSIAALGVVYGDIGTSPLYALRECFAAHAGLQVTPENVVGVLSLIIWSLLGLITGLYLGIVLGADNEGEGGILALLALVIRARAVAGATVGIGLVTLGLFGSALLYGDGIITPAISVLSAVEGLEVATSFFSPYVVPITLAILVALFLVQYRGTGRIGAVFGPITMVWFASIAILGTASLVQTPEVLAALDPRRGLRFLLHGGWHGFAVMGSVFLVVTGGEALYADMGHFSARAIRACWYVVVLPALLLNYLGQGALLIRDPATASNPFFRLVPGWALYPMVVLAAAATVIASQAVISGVFSLTRQAIQLGYLPRLEIRHTSAQEIGQIYLPHVNAIMLVATLLLVLAFRTSSNLAAAYGIAVTLTMVITIVLLFFAMRDLWRWSFVRIVAVTGLFLAVDLVFLGANALKIREGGWFPLALGVALYVLMMTWKRGRLLLMERLDERLIPHEELLRRLAADPPHRVPGTAVYLTTGTAGAPLALLQNLRHNKVLHKTVVFLTLQSVPRPIVPAAEKVRIQPVEGSDFTRVVASIGFMEQPDVPAIAALCRAQGLAIPESETTYFLGRESLIATERPGLPIWQESLFAFMGRNSQTAASYFRIPASQVLEIGTQIDL